MKKTLSILAAALIVGLFSGCGEKKENKPTAKQMANEAAGVVDYAIGAAQVQAGQRAQQKIQQINQQHNQDLDDALK